MARVIAPMREAWKSFTWTERRNIAIYVIGLMLYKFGVEAFNGSVIALATNRYDELARVTGAPSKTFERVGILTGANQACQCVGSILIAPLVQRYPTKKIMSAAILVFAVFSALLLVIDVATGGTFVPGFHPRDDFSYYGDYNTDSMIPVYCVCGLVHGMIELLRRIVPRDIVGGNDRRLRRLDALVNTCYGVSGTAGSFCTALVLIPRLGNNFSFLVTPILFAFTSLVWFFCLETVHYRAWKPLNPRPLSYIASLPGAFWSFLESVYAGALLVFANRKFIWLLPGYTVALYGHKYLEHGIAPAIARRYLGNSAWSQIIVGGCNLGGLLGSLFVILSTSLVPTPIPWSRLYSLALLVVWYLPFWYPSQGDVRSAFIVAATFLPISLGWAGGDFALAAYTQASLTRIESTSSEATALGAVMAFLYCTFIVTFAVSSPFLGRYIDGVSNGNQADIHQAIVMVGGVQLSAVSLLVMVATLIPKGAFAFNPKTLHVEDHANEVGDGVDIADFGESELDLIETPRTD